MPPRTSPRSHLIIVDSRKLLPDEFREAIRAHRDWSVAEANSRRKPTIALLVVDSDEQPSALINHFYTTVASVPTVVYDVAPAMHREANAFNAGANGYIVPGVTMGELAPVIHLAQQGGFGACPTAIRLMREQMRAPQEFSRREQEVVTLYALGASIQDVAAELDLTIQLVEQALARACRKAGVDSPVALVMLWTRWAMTDEAGQEYEDGHVPPRYAMSA